MRVSEVMHTPVVSTKPQATLREAAELMEAHNVGSLAVVDGLGYLTGIVTDRDIAIRGVGTGRSVDAPVESVMTRDVATVSPNADVSSAQTTMQKRGVRRLPVTDDMWRLHGMVSMDDIVRSFGHEMDAVADTLAVQSTHVR
jgi:CBS domain-containing protein